MTILITYYKEAIENGINQLLQAELTEHLNYPKHFVEGYNTGNSRNGGYNRKIYSIVHFFKNAYFLVVI